MRRAVKGVKPGPITPQEETPFPPTPSKEDIPHDTGNDMHWGPCRNFILFSLSRRPLKTLRQVEWPFSPNSLETFYIKEVPSFNPLGEAPLQRWKTFRAKRPLTLCFYFKGPLLTAK